MTPTPFNFRKKYAILKNTSFLFRFLCGLLMMCSDAQLCLTFCDPMDCSLQGSSIHGILLARILEWVAISSSRGSSQPRDWTQASRIAGGFFTSWATREAPSLAGSVICSWKLWCPQEILDAEWEAPHAQIERRFNPQLGPCHTGCLDQKSWKGIVCGLGLWATANTEGKKGNLDQLASSLWSPGL